MRAEASVRLPVHNGRGITGVAQMETTAKLVQAVVEAPDEANGFCSG
jgi:hypothetical protein